MAGVLISSFMTSILVFFGPQSLDSSDKMPDEKVQTSPDERDSEASQKLLGRYYLRGAMETASGLQLAEDRSFLWYLSVGALDILTGGRWSHQEGQVTLVYDPPKEGARYDPLGTVIMKIEGDNLVPPGNMSGGVYVKAKPRPESE
ncbi:MAG: hypothetical protein ABJP02_13750 [Parasphingorhabdus sp.]|uniref:hypothetical protein n=1 Tax=Parasphingorhabdus sp. TaxID=2709688 RepID=UPI003297EC91